MFAVAGREITKPIHITELYYVYVRLSLLAEFTCDSFSLCGCNKLITKIKSGIFFAHRKDTEQRYIPRAFKSRFAKTHFPSHTTRVWKISVNKKSYLLGGGGGGGMGARDA